MKLTTYLMMVCAMPLLLGCATSVVPTYQGPLFCDLYEVRRFSQGEVDARIIHGPANFKRDLVNNADWENECNLGEP